MGRIMLDLETMGTNSNAAITAIGAVRFGGGKILDRFQVIVDLQSCIDVGMEIDASTVLWWMEQSEEARSQFFKAGASIQCALLDFASWVGGVDDEMWGNGAAFDNVILSSAYRKCGFTPPWKFWNDRCYRTIKALYPAVEAKRVGLYHCAVDDAETQAVHLMEIEAMFVA